MLTDIASELDGCQPTAIECAVILAGTQTLLAIEHRQGRHPVTLASLQPHISWICADGKAEIVDVPSNSADFERITAEIANGGLLVAELDEDYSDPAAAAAHWLLQRAGPAQRDGERP